MARQYFEKTHWVYGYKGLTKSGRKTFWILVGVFYAIAIIACIYFFFGDIQESYFLLTHSDQIADIRTSLQASYGLIIIFLGILIPILIVIKIEPSLPHRSYKKTYYTEEYFCTGCGNYLGTREPTGKCSNCGSNRYSTEDPGAGKTVRYR